MKPEENSIKCPNCGSQIDVNDVLKHQLEEKMKSEFQHKFSELQRNIELKEQNILREKEEFEKKKQRENEIFQERLEQAKKSAEKEIQLKLKKQIEEEQKDQLEVLNKELAEKSEKLRELNKMQAQIAMLQREKSEMKEQIQAEAEKQLNEKINAERERIHKLEKEKSELREKELLKQIEDQKKLTEEMKRKQEQGSMQLQGEVMELAIEEYLSFNFPLDTIEEIKKGVTGADCVQIVNTHEVQNCGTIYYESKRTKNFSPAWIEKFKNDIREKKANIGVLVTEVLPSDMQRMGFRDGIWICTFEEFKGLVGVLRQSLISINTALASQQNKGGKMELLYDYLISDAFRMQIEAIVAGFTAMKSDLEKEKRAIQSQWKKREKNIELVTQNTIDMYGSIRGIAGNSMKSVQALELELDIEYLEA